MRSGSAGNVAFSRSGQSGSAPADTEMGEDFFQGALRVCSRREEQFLHVHSIFCGIDVCNAAVDVQKGTTVGAVE